jgi:hypothetical protein
LLLGSIGEYMIFIMVWITDQHAAGAPYTPLSFMLPTGVDPVRCERWIGH